MMYSGIIIIIDLSTNLLPVRHQATDENTNLKE